MSDRLAGLAAQYDLPAGAAGRLRSLLAHLAAAPTAPTTVRDGPQAVDVHVADSLSGLSVPALRSAARIADLGAGAGYPGLVLAIARPDAEVVLVESVGRKCAFMRDAIATAGVANASVVQARAESWADGLGASDAVVCRAVAALPVLVEYAAPVLRVGGTLVAWKGAPGAGEVAGGVDAAAALGLAPAPPVAVTPFEGSRTRHLYVYSKVRETPPGYPRRPGMAAKRPLRAQN